MRKYIIILIVIIITVGGFFVKHQYDNRKNEEKLVHEAQDHMKNYLKKDYKNVQEVHFSKNYTIDPTGGIEVSGYINNNKEKEFSGIYDPTNKEIGISVVNAEEK
ncbi:DUF1433 domain-containing protein [Bacillus sp. ISL-51]|uniref:DUF1433 domain-containing protein n=1 Tax=unclassified Bacillus (in: firmicutes) TaxID=185979 RepID=UPI001BEC1DA2|nr:MULTISPECIES: DUF1433 domain-containing protein [unclassified Bacillus (in: firmicutes)]MBT2574490.1 DUF1433 domain-containing protein [Bacillus sp. ISL-51]MBT2633307.1 DUF1433 domain-containing protein [Bacillus sp. ISL-26]